MAKPTKAKYVLCSGVNPFTRQQNFRMVQLERNCRQYFNVHLKWKISTIMDRKHYEKRRNSLLQAISPFLTNFSIAIYL